MKNRLLTLAKVAITVVLIYYSFSKVDLPEVGAKLASANFWLVLAALAAFVGAIAINAAKWGVLLRAQAVDVPFGAVLQYQFVGFFFNNVLPANIGGDVVRGYEMARYTDRTAEVAVSVVVDRVIGLIGYMSMAAVMAILLVAVLGYSELRVLVYLAMVSLTVIAVVLAVLLSRRLRRLFGRVFEIGFLTRLAPLYNSVSGSFDAYRFRYRALLMAYGLALCGLLASNVTNWLLFQATGGGVSFLVICLLNPLIALVLLIPISIGGLGLIQNVYPAFYGLEGVPYGQAIAASVLMSLVIFVGSLPGAVLWLRNRQPQAEPSPAPTPGQPTP